MEKESFKRKNYNELVDFKEVIGLYIDPKTTESQETTKGIVYYSKSGDAYIIPAVPIEDQAHNQVVNDQNIETRCRILLSVQRALISAITPNFRAIFVDWIYEYEKVLIKLYFILDQATEVDIEEAEGVSAEVIADFVNGSISIELVIVDGSKSIVSLGKACVFQRKE